MILLALLTIIPTVLGEKDCPYIYDNLNYSRTSILTIKGLPTNLVYNPNNKNLLFTLIDIETLQNDDIQTKMDQYILKDNEPIKIENVNGQASAVDVENNKIYIATDKGLSLLNDTNNAIFLSLKDEDIVQLFKPQNSEDLFAIFYPNNNVYRIDVKNNEKHAVENIPCAYIIAVDKRENIYFECDSKYIKVLLKGFQEPIEYVGLAKNSARALAVDTINRVILAANDGLYHLRPDNVIPRKLMELDFIPSGITFHNGDIYIATTGIIYKYTMLDCSK